MHERRARGRQTGASGGAPDRQPLDDWLGEISDEDWSEDAAELAASPRDAPGGRESERRTDGDVSPWNAEPATPVAATDTRRAAVERRRAVAGVVLLLVIGLAAAAAVLALRDGAESPVSESPTITAPTGTETDPVTTTSPSTTPTETAPTETTPTAPSDDATAFALPEGTKLQRGEDTGESDLTVSTDPELIEALQRALVSAGFDPGTPDGTFGQATEEAVIAFQGANGLTPDGIVGPETAEALSRAGGAG